MFTAYEDDRGVPLCAVTEMTRCGALSVKKNGIALIVALLGGMQGVVMAADLVESVTVKRMPLGVNAVQEPGGSKKAKPVHELPAAQVAATVAKGGEAVSVVAEPLPAPVSAPQAVVTEVKPVVPTVTPKVGSAAPAKDSSDAARQALAKQEGDVDNKQLAEEVLQKTEKNYTLLKKGAFDFSYDVNYSYISADRIDYALGSNAQNQVTLTRFQIERDATHTVTNTITMDYGLRNNLTVGTSLPLVYKYDSSQGLKRWAFGLGDMSASVRWQPLEVSRRWPSLTLNGSLRMPTGISPYEIVAGKELSTGSGTWGASFSGNVSKVIDPVVLYGSFGYGMSFKKTGLNQVRGNENRRITAVKPGNSISFGAGFGYALSYDVALNVSTSLSWNKESVLTFNDGTSIKLDMETSGTLNFGLSWRLDPKYTLGFNVGIGMTNESPDFQMGLNLPLSF
ncbi:transporter [Chitinivorax sp. B]|uniref:transporter n=1 Tax=Chitinivorax sp. B TaxID=2502235 RepID=UPI0010F94E4C|nr:transporter [Chitinivorax sp. B]